MRIIARRELPRLLRQAGLDAQTRAFAETRPIARLTVSEREQPPFTKGPHRKVTYPDGSVEGPFPVQDRPALSRFIAQVFEAQNVEAVLATVAEGTFWLNNKAQAAYLHNVPDAQRVAAFLRRRGLTDRFQGGFQIPRAHFASILPILAANTFAGGSDVLFASLSLQHPFTALACHHFDLHITSPDAHLLDSIAELAAAQNLNAECLLLPDLPELDEIDLLI